MKGNNGDKQALTWNQKGTVASDSISINLRHIRMGQEASGMVADCSRYLPASEGDLGEKNSSLESKHRALNVGSSRRRQHGAVQQQTNGPYRRNSEFASSYIQGGKWNRWV